MHQIVSSINKLSKNYVTAKVLSANEMKGGLFNYCEVCEIRKWRKEKGDSILFSATFPMLRCDWIKTNPLIYSLSRCLFSKAKRALPIIFPKEFNSFLRLFNI
jgi:hypothetical protein